VTVTEAFLLITASSDANNVTVNLTLSAADEDDATRPVSVADANGRTRTTATVAWNNVSAWSQNVQYQSRSIVTVIQELVSRAGWAGDHVLMFAEDNGSTVNASRKGRSFRGDPARAAELHVKYSLTPSPVPPTTYYLLKEDGDALLKEDGDHIVKEDQP